MSKPLTLITNRDESKRAQELLLKKLEEKQDKEGYNIKIRHRGRMQKRTVHWSTKLGIWWAQNDDHDNRFWNAFGVGEPKWNKKSSLSIVCEINPPREGINGSSGGAFAKEEDERYLLHRGRIGGGKTRITKERFQEEFKEALVRIEGEEKPLAVVSSFNDSKFAENIAAFVKKVYGIKEKLSQENREN
ncbi:MAG: hypothetical protein NWF04_07395 [Candidatus Bathyarchaeota archaeon]|nr:hypothetical protein [Candidatus Bathyarchaeota archaeon]